MIRVSITIRAMTQRGQRGNLQARMPDGLLGKLSPCQFLLHHWQKRPLFVPGAIPDCGSWLCPSTLFTLAARSDVQSRLVISTRNRWTVQHGPFRRADLRGLPTGGWTLLVQGLEQHLSQAIDLLGLFSFAPHARLDDLMVSYAPPGGGVGPHFDSYDVFLLQGAGTRRWRVSAQKNLDCVENAPLRILKNFSHTREWITQHGDLLYLPPRYAHDGVALDDCMTLSIGFRAPRKRELASRFLEFLQDDLQADGALGGLYEDPDLRLQKHPAALSPAMLEKITRVLRHIRWNAHDVGRFAGCYLSEPAAQTVFKRPRRAVALPEFVRRVSVKGVRLALPTRMLFRGGTIFINGESHLLPPKDHAPLVRLADRRVTPAFTPSHVGARLLHAWYRAGYIKI